MKEYWKITKERNRLFTWVIVAVAIIFIAYMVLTIHVFSGHGHEKTPLWMMIFYFGLLAHCFIAVLCLSIHIYYYRNGPR